MVARGRSVCTADRNTILYDNQGSGSPWSCQAEGLDWWSCLKAFERGMVQRMWGRVPNCRCFGRFGNLPHMLIDRISQGCGTGGVATGRADVPEPKAPAAGGGPAPG